MNLLTTAPGETQQPLRGSAESVGQLGPDAALFLFTARVWSFGGREWPIRPLFEDTSHRRGKGKGRGRGGGKEADACELLS